MRVEKIVEFCRIEDKLPKIEDKLSEIEDKAPKIEDKLIQTL